MKRLFVVPAILLIVSTAFGQAYPTKPIRLVVPSAAGGTPDIQARIIANELGRQTGQQVVVDNRGGASGIIGYEVIAKSAPDGYTLGYSAFTFITNPLTYSKLSYDSAKDFQPIIRQVSGTNIVGVTPALPVRSARELVELARAEPRKLSYGANGGGSSQQLSLELLKNMTGTQITQVYYKAIQQAIADTIGGQIQVVCDNSPSILPHVLSGRLRAIGVTGLNHPGCARYSDDRRAGLSRIRNGAVQRVHVSSAHAARNRSAHECRAQQGAAVSEVCRNCGSVWKYRYGRNAGAVRRTYTPRDAQVGSGYQGGRYQDGLTQSDNIPLHTVWRTIRSLLRAPRQAR
jgi:tripartite-type tricarboxylate transporter receptor subunit TctC